jgi:subtilisin family serine protease
LVGAIDSNLDILPFTTVNDRIDVYAPGKDIYAIEKNNSVNCFSGTSVATPIVASLIVLIKAKNPNFQPPEVENLLKGSSDVFLVNWKNHNKKNIRKLSFKKTLGHLEEN